MILTGLTASGCGQIAASEARAAHAGAARDAIARYERSSESPLARCVNARLVALAYIDARDWPSVRAWQARRAIDCRAAYVDVASGVGREPAQPHP